VGMILRLGNCQSQVSPCFTLRTPRAFLARRRVALQEQTPLNLR